MGLQRRGDGVARDGSQSGAGSPRRRQRSAGRRRVDPVPVGLSRADRRSYRARLRRAAQFGRRLIRSWPRRRASSTYSVNTCFSTKPWRSSRARRTRGAVAGTVVAGAASAGARVVRRVPDAVPRSVDRAITQRSSAPTSFADPQVAGRLRRRLDERRLGRAVRRVGVDTDAMRVAFTDRPHPGSHGDDIEPVRLSRLRPIRPAAVSRRGVVVPRLRRRDEIFGVAAVARRRVEPGRRRPPIRARAAVRRGDLCGDQTHFVAPRAVVAPGVLRRERPDGLDAGGRTARWSRTPTGSGGTCRSCGSIRRSR